MRFAFGHQPAMHPVAFTDGENAVLMACWRQTITNSKWPGNLWRSICRPPRISNQGSGESMSAAVRYNIPRAIVETPVTLQSGFCSGALPRHVGMNLRL